MRGTRTIDSRLSRSLLLATAGLLAAGASACSGSANASGQASDVGPVSGTSTATSQHHNTGKSTPPTVDSARSTAADSTTSNSITSNSITSNSTNTKAVTPECKASSLSLSLGQGDAGMSQQYQALRFTNTGSKACVIVGFPGVSYVTGDSGRQVGAAAVRDGKIGAQLTLRPGEVASTTIHSVDAQVFDAAACKPTPVRGYRVYAPDDTAAMFVPLPSGVEGCAGSTPDPQLSVASIVSGANGQS